MAVRIRLTRMGSRHRPFYRLVVADSRIRRDGRPKATLGYYNPLTNPAQFKVDGEAALGWLQNGAQPTDTAKSLLKETGVWQKFQLIKQGKSPEDATLEAAKIVENRKSRLGSLVVEETKPEPAAEPEPAGEEVSAAEEVTAIEEPTASSGEEDAEPVEKPAEPQQDETPVETVEETDSGGTQESPPEENIEETG